MAQPPIGIDLGTSTSEICFFEDGQAHPIQDPQSPYKSPIVPSIVAVDRHGKLRVGNAALAYTNKKGSFVREVKRLMGSEQEVSLGGKSYRPEEISAQILLYMKSMAEERLGCTIRDVVISVPANFESAARSSTRVAAEIAGLNVVRLINEPTAAALAFGIKNIDLEANAVVFDFGGGTLDVTVLEMMEGVLDVRASYGDTKLGGRDIDGCIIKMIRDELNTQHPNSTLGPQAPSLLKKAAEEAKLELSRSDSTFISVPFVASENGLPIDLEMDLSRADFETAIRPILQRARECLLRALEEADVTPDNVDKVILVGGTTYIPAVRELVGEVLGSPPRADVPADMAVALGATIHAASASGKLNSDNDIILSDCCPMGLGIEVVSQVGGRLALVYDSLIDLNQKIPYTVKRDYTLLSPDQREVEFKLYQDRTGEAVFPAEAIFTGIQGRIEGIPPSLYGSPHPIAVEFIYDTNGEVRIKATIPGMSKECSIAFNSSALHMTEEEIALARERLAAAVSAGGKRELWQSSPLAGDVAPLIEKAEEALSRIPPQERSPLLEIVSSLKDALASGHAEQVEDTKAALVDALLDLEHID